LLYVSGRLRPPFFANLVNPAWPLAEHEFLDLAGRGFWQEPEDHGPGRLEAGEVGAAEGDDIFRRGVGFGFEGHKGAGRFTPHRIGARHHRRLEHGRVPIEDILNLDREMFSPPEMMISVERSFSSI